MGNVTVAIVKSQSAGSMKEVIADVTFSSSYGAGGDSYTAAQFGMGRIIYIGPTTAQGSATTGYMVLPDLANNKLRLLGGAASGVALAETATAGQTSTVARLLVRGDTFTP